MDCKHCGKELPEEAKFCLHCGQPVTPAEEKPEKPEINAAKLRKWIVGGIALVGVIILVAVIGGLKNDNQRNADPTPEPEQAIEVFEPEELPEQPEEEPTPEPEEEEIDPNSVIIPDLGEFFLKKRLFEKGHGDVGYKYDMINFPEAALEGVREEIFGLLADPKYQLELEWEDSYYFEDEGTTSYYYYFTYTGSNPNIGEVYISEAKDPYTFQLTIYDMWAEDGIFDIGVFFNENFEEVKSGKHTQQDVGEQIADTTADNGGSDDWEHNSDLYNHTPPASKLKCLTCDGDGDCTTCGGSGYKRIGGAKAGCTTCRGNGKCRTCKGSGTR